jgi:hypothetical protein
MFSDKIVSCHKEPAERVLFHAAEMKGHIRAGSIRRELVRAFRIEVCCEKSGHPPFVEEHFVDVVITRSKGNGANL